MPQLLDQTTDTSQPNPANPELQNPAVVEEPSFAEALGIEPGNNEINWDEASPQDDPPQLGDEPAIESEPQSREDVQQPEPENPTPEPVEDPYPYLTDKDLTKGMKKRIGKMKDREENLRNQIEQQDEIITQLRQVSLAKNQFDKIKNEDLTAIDNELAELTEKLEGAEAELLEPVDAIKLVNKQNKAELRRRDIQAALEQKEQWQIQSQTLRRQSDQKALELHPWVGDAESAEHQVMKAEIWPYMQAIIPDFQDMPNNVLLASTITEHYLKARLFDQHLGRKSQPRNPDRIPPSNVTQTDGLSRTPANRGVIPSKVQLKKDIASGKISVAEAVMRMSGM